MKKLNEKMKGMLLAIAFCSCMSAVAQEQDTARWKPLLGVELTSELQATHRGRYNFANILRLRAELPICQGLSAEMATLSTCMTSQESIGGDLQVFSNVDAGNVPFALALCGLNWEVAPRHRLFLGIRNMNEDYFISPVTSLYTNSSWGIFPTISSNFPIANYPCASVGIHYSYTSARVEVQGSLYNGNGYSRFTGRDNVFRFCPQSDGIFSLAQVAYIHDDGQYFLGFCGRYGDVDSGKRRLGTAVWAYTEQQVAERFSFIAAYSHSFAQGSECTDFVGIGGKYDWRKCQFGLFTDYAHFAQGGESATELTCRVALNEHISLQPSLHLISSPSGDGGNQFHGAGTVRLVVSY